MYYCKKTKCNRDDDLWVGSRFLTLNYVYLAQAIAIDEGEEAMKKLKAYDTVHDVGR